MTQELDEKLCAKYPLIFADRHKNMRETAMCWGFECGDGWHGLIDRLCSKIQAYLDRENKQGRNVSQVVATQIKEKFGGLRFYVNGGDLTTEAYIDLAEHLSFGICEGCGTTKDVATKGNGWIKTLCNECRGKNG